MIINQVGGGGGEGRIAVLIPNTDTVSVGGAKYTQGYGLARINGTTTKGSSGNYRAMSTGAFQVDENVDFENIHISYGYLNWINLKDTNITAINAYAYSGTITYPQGCAKCIARKDDTSTSSRVPNTITSTTMRHNYDGLIRAYYLAWKSTSSTVAESWIDFEQDGSVVDYYCQPTDRWYDSALDTNCIITRLEMLT